MIIALISLLLVIVMTIINISHHHYRLAASQSACQQVECLAHVQGHRQQGWGGRAEEKPNKGGAEGYLSVGADGHGSRVLRSLMLEGGLK